MATLGLSKVFILDKYFTELQKFWETEKKLQGSISNWERIFNGTAQVWLGKGRSMTAATPLHTAKTKKLRRLVVGELTCVLQLKQFSWALLS
ncbi:hypothetical protein K0M31_013569 [Melipona bicolor]|uniref:Uncharacterized protein n=1 Tax=Melipona bicolor TaxID=60889 RepID=A0AA40FHN1_9HYME|nr:hypothetical protein K0M31_013569 [Melipona bicolor]